MIKVGIVFSISNFFINKIALANIWMSFSCSNLALLTLRQLLHFVLLFEFWRAFTAIATLSPHNSLSALCAKKESSLIASFFDKI
jgi:hypothetical protein